MSQPDSMLRTGWALRWFGRLEPVLPDEALIVTNRQGDVRVYFESVRVLRRFESVIRVDLRSHLLPIELTGRAGVSTRDDYRLDVRATFYVRVARSQGDVLSAVSHVGAEMLGDIAALGELLTPKLAELVRQAAAELDADTILRRTSELSEVMFKMMEDEYSGFRIYDIALDEVCERQSVD